MKTAFRDVSCEDCADLIAEGEPIYFTDEGKLCLRCGERDHLVCPTCRTQKKPQYKHCFQCNSHESGEIRKKKTFTVGGKAGKKE